jgi:chromosome condensin MukBEF MukE localization factor|tara:strand:+ start:798 stop:1208 length:411 start_codon:yes stop_codon:yes gene_type:complete
MAIATLPTTNSTAEIVYTLDPDVTPKNGGKGWVLLTDATTKAGADVVEVRPLNIDERSAALDVDGLHSSMVSRCRRGIVSVNGERKQAAINEWLSACPTEAIFLLGCYVASVTAGEDPQESQKAFFGDGDDASEGD